MVKINKYFVLFSIIFIVLSSCKNEQVEKEYRPRGQHEDYINSLKLARLDETLLFKKFIDQSVYALTKPIEVEIPYSEVFYIDHSIPTAYGYKFDLKKGQKVKIRLDLFSSDSCKIFVDVFRIKDSSNTNRLRIASADKDSLYIEFLARRNAEYILRIQPELLCDVQCNLSIEKESSLEFPVIGKNKDAIQSFYGDPRDGGKRKHHGVDIFAKKNTEIIASENGYIIKTGKSKIGGNFVWIYYPSVGVNCYYAHLENISLKFNSKVKPGTVIGTVGNTGNAKLTPPHLHFGTYQSGVGPVNPYYYIATENKSAEKVQFNSDFFNTTYRTKSPNCILTLNNEFIKLQEHSDLEILSVCKNRARVRIPDGKQGFIDLDKIEKANINSIRSCKVMATNLLDKPFKDALIISNLKFNQEIKIISVFNNFCKILLESGQMGWVQLSQIYDQVET